MLIPEFEKTDDKKVRERYSTLAGVLGVVCNLFLFALKLTVGVIMSSIAVISDAFNNLSDIGTSVVSIVSAKMSNKNPDREHPFGHGRIEYVASLIVSFLIMLVGVELIKTSAENIFAPKPVDLTPPLVIFLALSVLVKVWMFVYNRYLGRKINSSLLLAASKDSLCDSISTLAVIIASVLGYVFSGERFAGTFLSKIPYDGIIGLCVSLIIIYGGFSMAKDVVRLLLGSAPDPELVRKISEAVLSGEGILGAHDLIVHDYGPGRVIASVHAEVPVECDIVRIHETIDAIEQSVKERLGIILVIHMDPIAVNNERTDSLKALVYSIVREFNEEYSIHDFRITDGENRVNMIFDMVVPCDTANNVRKEAVDYIKRRLLEINTAYHAVIQIDNSY